MPNCLRCGAKTRLLQDYCDKCLAEDYKKEESRKVERATKLAEDKNRIDSVILTTAPYVEGHAVEETLAIITSETVFGMNLLRDLFAGVTDVIGGRSKASQKVLADARKICLSELKAEAVALGANAVIAVDLNYNEISGSGKSMLFLVASGTAVRLSKTRTSHRENVAQ